MAKRAVAQFKRAKRLLQSLMLARLASVVLLSQDALARGDARREMTAAVATINVELSDESVAAGLGALLLLLLLVGRRVSAEELEGKVFVLRALLRRQRLEPLKLDEGLRAVAPAPIEHAGDDDDAVDLPGRELLLVLNQPHRSLHRSRVFPVQQQ